MSDCSAGCLVLQPIRTAIHPHLYWNAPSFRVLPHQLPGPKMPYTCQRLACYSRICRCYTLTGGPPERASPLARPQHSERHSRLSGSTQQGHRKLLLCRQVTLRLISSDAAGQDVSAKASWKELCTTTCGTFRMTSHISESPCRWNGDKGLT